MKLDLEKLQVELGEKRFRDDPNIIRREEGRANNDLSDVYVLQPRAVRANARTHVRKVENDFSLTPAEMKRIRRPALGGYCLCKECVAVRGIPDNKKPFLSIKGKATMQELKKKNAVAEPNNVIPLTTVDKLNQIIADLEK